MRPCSIDRPGKYRLDALNLGAWDMTRDDLEAGVAAGIITRAQLEALWALADKRIEAPVADEEKFRVLGGFNDILVAIGIGLLITGLIVASGAMNNAFVITLVSIASAWGLAEFFTAKLRLALPSILLSLMFVGSVAFLAGTLLGGAGDTSAMVTAGLGATGAALLHHWRFRVPIDIAIAAAGIVGVVGALVLASDTATNLFSGAALVCGLAVFGLGMFFDMRDPARLTRLADIGFWLHLLAAPLIVHSIVAGFVGAGSGGDGIGDNATAALVLVLFILFALVAIIVDRRALLVSGLGYAGYAMAQLFERVGGEGSVRAAVTLVALALVVLAVSAGWRSLRALIVPLLPLGSLAQRLPPVRRA